MSISQPIHRRHVRQRRWQAFAARRLSVKDRDKAPAVLPPTRFKRIGGGGGAWRSAAKSTLRSRPFSHSLDRHPDSQ